MDADLLLKAKVAARDICCDDEEANSGAPCYAAFPQATGWSLWCASCRVKAYLGAVPMPEGVGG